MTDLKSEFRAGLVRTPVNFKSYGIKAEKRDKAVKIQMDGREFALRHGSVVIAAITSCTNTSNPSVMLGAGIR